MPSRHSPYCSCHLFICELNENGKKASLAKQQATKIKRETELERLKLKQNTLECTRDRLATDKKWQLFFASLDNAFYFETKATENHYTTSSTSSVYYIVRNCVVHYTEWVCVWIVWYRLPAFRKRGKPIRAILASTKKGKSERNETKIAKSTTNSPRAREKFTLKIFATPVVVLVASASQSFRSIFNHFIWNFSFFACASCVIVVSNFFVVVVVAVAVDVVFFPQ